MPRFEAINPEQADGKAGQLLQGVQKKLGMVPNLMRTFANSPAALEAYLGFSTALSKGALSGKLREQIALAVSEANGCNYCLAAHSAIGKMLGLTEQDIRDNRRGESPDRKVEAALRFAGQVVEKRGWVTDEDVGQARAAGYGDGEIVEIISNVAFSILTNYFNHAAQADVDFPAVEAGAPQPACACA